MVRLPDRLTLLENFEPSGLARPPVNPRDASTVVLLSENPAPEVFLQSREPGMNFAGGITAFPGGGVDPRDTRMPLPWCGPEPQWWARQFHCSVDLASALVCAAVRETFEECGVLLAGPDSSEIVENAARYVDERRALASGTLSLASFLNEAGLVLRSDLLRPWANWVTPTVEPRRYDTRFFLAGLPEGQHADAVTSEATSAYWQTPAGALASWRGGTCELLAPTWAILTELVEYLSVSEAWNAERALPKIVPEVVFRDESWRLVIPEESGAPAAIRKGE